jgi:uncharacterized membrane protein
MTLLTERMPLLMGKRLSPRYWPTVIWLFTMIAIPILRWVQGEDVVRVGVMAGVVLQAIASLTLLYSVWGPRETARVAALVIPLAWLVERTGSTTGIPFGRYHYTEALAPLLGGVPWIIPLAWLMMLPPAWAVATRITGRSSGWRFVAVSAAAFTAWDLFLDPQMVGWGYWVWAEPGGYFGIPWVNYAGWLLAAALITWIVRPRPLGEGAATLLPIYIITWLLQTGGQALFWGQPGPAAIGFLVMGYFVFSALRSRPHPTITQSTN